MPSCDVDLPLAWRVTDRDPRTVEAEYMQTFVAAYGSLPFANIVN